MRYAIALVLATFTHFASPAAAAEEVTTVEVAPVTRSEGKAVLNLPGTVLSIRDSQISVEVSGRLKWIAEVGEQIEEGAPLAVIDDHMLQLQLRNDEARIARVRADIDYNTRQIARLERLAEQDNTSRSELDEIQSRLQMLLQELRIAEVERDRTAYDIERAQLRAPFAGVIASRTASLGEYAEPGDPLLRLVDTATLEISVNAPLRAARFNQPGSSVAVSAQGERVMARIRAMVPVGDSLSRMMELRLALEHGHWHIGQAVTVELRDSLPTATLSVPRDALVLRDNEVFVYRLSADNTATRVAVTPGAGFGEEIAVEGALAPGELVVVRGAERLQDGQSVRISQRRVGVLPQEPG